MNRFTCHADAPALGRKGELKFSVSADPEKPVMFTVALEGLEEESFFIPRAEYDALLDAAVKARGK